MGTHMATEAGARKRPLNFAKKTTHQERCQTHSKRVKSSQNCQDPVKTVKFHQLPCVSSKPVLFFSFVFYLKVSLDQAHGALLFLCGQTAAGQALTATSGPLQQPSSSSVHIPPAFGLTFAEWQQKPRRLNLLTTPHGANGTKKSAFSRNRALSSHSVHAKRRYERRAKERAERDEAAVVEVICPR